MVYYRHKISNYKYLKILDIMILFDYNTSSGYSAIDFKLSDYEKIDSYEGMTYFYFKEKFKSYLESELLNIKQKRELTKLFFNYKMSCLN